MNNEVVHKFDNYVMTYDTGIKDRSSLLVCKIDKVNFCILGELYDESADIMNSILVKLNSKINKLNNTIDKLEEHIETCLDEVKQNDVYDRTSYEQGVIAGLESALFRLQELKGDSNDI